MTNRSEIAANQRFNVYDTLFYSPSSYALDGPQPHVRLFGNANIGSETLCNLWSPGSFPHGNDRDAYITGWYARTTLAPSPVFEEWAKLTRVHFRMSDRRLASASMAELLARHERMPIPRVPEAGIDAVTEAANDREVLRAVGRALYEKHRQQRGHSWEWPVLTDEEQERWADLASTARDQLDGGRVLLCPQRMWFQIEVETPSLQVDRMREVVLAHEGAAALWVHLEGYERDPRLRDW